MTVINNLIIVKLGVNRNFVTLSGERVSVNGLFFV